MTRSEQSPRSPSVAKKAFRTQAKEAGVSYREAVTARNEMLATKKVPKAAGVVRRNPGRMDGMRWNGDSFICVANVDGDNAPQLEDEVLQDARHALAGAERTPANKRPAVLASLLDIAKPAKAKGVAKQFEVVDAVSKIIALDDDDAQTECWELDIERDEEWEDLYESEEEESDGSDRQTYAAALRKHGP